MYFIYSLLLALGFLILLPRFVYDALKHGKYITGFRERAGNLSHEPIQPLIWIHCVSVGETRAARPLVLELKRQFPQLHLAISTTTVTGQHTARQIFGGVAENIFYFPFDWRWTVRRALNTLQPAAVLIMETELWPAFLRECAQRKIPVALVNGRLSERSFRRYRLFKKFMSRVLRDIRLAIMQTEADAARLQALGIEENKLMVAGNLKFDGGSLPVNQPLADELNQRFGFSERPLILAASTHAPEERILIEAYKRLTSTNCPAARLAIAPRHPERFSEVASLIESSALSWTRRTAIPNEFDRQAQVVLLDSIGELPSLYPLAAVVFVGGSIARTGGHNILEPAAVGASILTGPHTFNFKDVVNKFVAADAMVQLQTDGEPASVLATAFSDLLADGEKRRSLGQRAQRLVTENQGATLRTVEQLRPLLEKAMASVHAAKTQ
ncbi:MAG TPA: 3-deoxy-D-manno-octulosonic acid transferase [Pyrinomonadaceae bacterium]|nr:3-deoxy-D-manno-octulosonic acid transferase [Pyrinomonadaceae bacterium]